MFKNGNNHVEVPFITCHQSGHTCLSNGIDFTHGKQHLKKL
jgi:hypothetical protein